MERDNNGGFSSKDVYLLVNTLDKWNGKKLPDELYTKLADMIPMSTLETVILRKSDDKTHILLIPRPENDIIWKGMLHSPGGGLRKMDYFRADNLPNNGVFERIQKNEIGTLFTEIPKFVGVVETMTARGPEVSQVFLTKINENEDLVNNAKWYDIDELAKMPNFIQHQMLAVNMAVSFFETNL